MRGSLDLQAYGVPRTEERVRARHAFNDLKLLSYADGACVSQERHELAAKKESIDTI